MIKDYYGKPYSSFSPFRACSVLRAHAVQAGGMLSATRPHTKAKHKSTAQKKGGASRERQHKHSSREYEKRRNVRV